ncbi:MAG: Mur ligase domain-containing protein, partial [Eubacterium sp.]
MKLNRILEDPEILEVRNNKPELDVYCIVYNSLKVVPNSMFVAIEGLKTDGHRYIPGAIEKGATIIIYENDLD